MFYTDKPVNARQSPTMPDNAAMSFEHAEDAGHSMWSRGVPSNDARLQRVMASSHKAGRDTWLWAAAGEEGLQNPCAGERREWRDADGPL